MSSHRYDVIIQGAGMVGLALAAALLQQGRRVALLESRPIERFDGGEMRLRVSALSLASEQMLRRLGAWETMQRLRVSPYRGMRVWDAEGGGEIAFDAGAMGEPHLGHIVENEVTQSALYERIADDPNLSLFVPGAVQSLHADADAARVGLSDGRQLEAALVVAADGAQSSLRQLAGIELDQSDYGQSGLVCVIRCEHRNGEIARQRFLPGGPLALLPLADGRCSIVWSLPSAEAERWLAAPDDAFRDALTEASEGALGEVLECGPRAAFPLRSSHARSYIGNRLALVGDAAHTIHPLAGQGVNLGFLDAAALAEVIARAAGRGRDIGGQATLRAYERWRKGDNLLMQRAMDGFHLLFGTQAPLLVQARSLGLGLTDRLSPLKRLLMSHAMGLRGDLPPLARPA